MINHLSDELSAFLDEELSEAELGQVTTHLADCLDCRAELDTLASVRSQVRSLPMIEVPRGVIEAAPPVERLVPGWRRSLVGAAAAAMLIAVVGVGVGSNGRNAVPLPLDQAFEQHVARASVDPGFNVIQVQAVLNR